MKIKSVVLPAAGALFVAGLAVGVHTVAPSHQAPAHVVVTTVAQTQVVAPAPAAPTDPAPLVAPAKRVTSANTSQETTTVTDPTPIADDTTPPPPQAPVPATNQHPDQNGQVIQPSPPPTP